MSKIGNNILKATKEKGVSLTDLGKELFPSHKSPYRSMKTMVDECKFISLEQVSIICKKLKIKPNDLFR